ncbi:MAG: 30S ribosomal protein S17 [Verrucomicrobia bacterium]|nr:30S ribosomal protein S17 [Verrucomicrobiota bacterium]
MEDRKPIKRKFREGVVISNKMAKTVTVRVERREQHPEFQKSIIRGKKYYAHNEDLDIAVGAKVKIVETKPLSKLKRWRVVEVIG